MSDTEMIRRLTMLLDAALPLLDAEAARERRREAGKRMRQITCQQRAKAAREMIAAAEERLEGCGYDG